MVSVVVGLGVVVVVVVVACWCVRAERFDCGFLSASFCQQGFLVLVDGPEDSTYYVDPAWHPPVYPLALLTPCHEVSE